MASQRSHATGKTVSTFPIPASLHDLERAPYNLLPYPYDFNDDDEAARADSFSGLVHLLEQGNRTLSSGGIALFESQEEDDAEPWMDEDRVQALYTLVRKSTSLAPNTRTRLVAALCQALKTLSAILETPDHNSSPEEVRSQVMPQTFRDAFACHLYMLFSIMFFAESEAKVGNSLKSGSCNRNERGGDTDLNAGTRAVCAEAMLIATQAMAANKARLWPRGVPDEAVIILPCRISFQMLESATGVIARKASSGDAAMAMIAATADSSEGLISTIVAALMDLMHSYEHMAPLCAELCCMVSETPTNRLAIEMLREIGRLNTNGLASVDDGGRASGIRNVAPFIPNLATLRPRVVLNNIAHLMPHLNSEMYNLRSSIVTAIAIILSSSDGLKEGDSQASIHDESHEMLDAAKTRGALLDILSERVVDVSSFTRSAVLKAWIQVVQTRSLPAERFIPVAQLAIDRLQDKTILVRRQAMQLLTVLLENNPYMGNLDPERYRIKLAELYDFIKSNLPENIREAHEAALVEAERSEDEATLRELEQATLSAAIAEAADYQTSDDLSEQQELFRNKVQALKFTQGCLDFIEIFENANKAFQGMLLSANSSDVTEALRFFVQARHFQLPCAVTGMKNALALMWSTEQAIREEVRKAFVEVFIAEPGTDGKEPLPNDQIAENLLVLVKEASVSELASIEEAMVSLVKDEKIPADVFQILFSVVSKGSRDARAAAMQLISMAAGADKSIIDSKSRLKLLLDSCLGDYTEDHKDWRLACAAACALQKVERAIVDESCAKYLVLERVMEQLCSVARGDWCTDKHPKTTLEWFSASEEAIKAIFVVSPEPEKSCSEIVQGMYMSTFRNCEDGNCHSLRLARFFHVLGNIALNLLCYTEEISSGVRQANAKKTLQKQIEADKKKAEKGQQDSSKSKNGEESEDDMEAELGIAAQVEAETERQMAEIAETEILGRGLINAFAPLLVRVVGNEGGKFNSEVLMQASMLALCKFMCVSASFCERHLPLVFSTLARAPKQDTTMRANTVICLGDLAFRFPNEFEPYTPHLYECLRDTSTKVRRHTLMVLTHLILNDMVKVKGQVCEIAMCLEDDDARIRDMARLLFHSLANRSNNPIYNLLPDIISQLSQLEISRDSFRNIMVFLLGFIKKERQSTMLTEKLALRMCKSTSISQKADLAYCISQLKHSEKSCKWLIDNFKLYKDALFDEDVKKSFMTVISKAKKSSKSELRTVLDEWEGTIVEAANRGKEDAFTNSKAERARKKRSKAKKTKNTEELEFDKENQEIFG